MSRVRYSTNWMGPVSMDWYSRNGLTKKVTIVLEKDSIVTDRKAGDTVEIDEITEHYSGGRIDFFNPYNDSAYPDEMGVPLMRLEDWNSFSEWLTTFETDDILTLEQLVYVYELKNPKIRWWKENE